MQHGLRLQLKQQTDKPVSLFLFQHAIEQRSKVLQGARGSLSQDLVALWVDEYGPALSLLRRIFPPGLMRYLNVKKQAPPSPVLVNPSQPHQVQLAQFRARTGGRANYQ